MRTTLWPTGLIGRVGIVLFAAVMLELVGSTFVFEQAELVSSDDAQARRIADMVYAAARVLDATSVSNRTAVAEALSEPTIRLGWQEASDDAKTTEGKKARSLYGKLLRAEPSLAKRGLWLRTDRADPEHAVEGGLSLDDKSSLRFKPVALGSSLPSLYDQFGSIIILSCCVLLAALLVVRTLTAPLRMLVSATDAIGHGPPIHLDEQGPREIRRVASAFNAMQLRISNLVKDRTEALAAVSHDLRTPIARMQLRAGFLPSPEDQAAFEADLNEMEAMLVDLNAFLRGETDPEKPRPTDIAAILQTLIDAATDAGHQASYNGPDHLTFNLRALSMKRAFSNIVNNALNYGGNVRISLSERSDRISIAFDDDGPGIPEAERTAVFEPFFRGDSSRSRVTGGMGLGLAIARQVVWRHGGTIEIANRSEGGLTVTIELPRDPDA